MSSKIIYKCQTCFREYKLKTYYDRHILSCKFLCKSFKELNREEYITLIASTSDDILNKCDSLTITASAFKNAKNFASTDSAIKN